jgi:ankyrin repeat protein
LILNPELCYFGPCGNDWLGEADRLGVFTRSKRLKNHFGTTVAEAAGYQEHKDKPIKWSISGFMRDRARKRERAIFETANEIIKKGDLLKIKELLSKNPRIVQLKRIDPGSEYWAEYVWTLLQEAVSAGQKAIVDLLLAHGADANAVHGQSRSLPPLHIAAETGRQDIAESLIKAGADVNLRVTVGSDCAALVPLCLACQRGHYAVAEILIRNGADININDYLNTPLHHAAKTGRIDIAELLIRNGADINALRPSWNTPLHHAVDSGHKDMVAFLIGEGADINVMSGEVLDSKTPLGLAAAKGHYRIVALLIEKGAAVNKPDKRGNTPLHLAGRNRHLNAAQLLIASGADVYARNKDNYTPIDVTPGSRDDPIRQMLYMDLLAPVSDLARALLSKSIEISDAAIIKVLDLSRSGSQEGLRALEEAICRRRGKQTTDFYSPGLRMFDGLSQLDEAPKKLLELAQRNALWTTPPNQVQELLSISQVGGVDVRTIWSKAKELGCNQDQVRAIQLLGLHLAVQVILSRERKSDTGLMSAEKESSGKQLNDPTVPSSSRTEGVKQDEAKGKLKYEKAATEGDAQAQYNLAMIYYYGKDVNQDLGQAKMWYEKAAAQGHVYAQYSLAVLYAKGMGIKQDLKQAKLWYEKAAAQGDMSSQYNLGRMYADGRGVKQDLALAKLWFEKAASQGDAAAVTALNILKSG